MAIRLLYVIIGGGLGALLRYLLSGIIQKQSASLFPYGTLVVNLIGALLIGFLWELFQNITVSTNIRVFIFMGIIGAFTTFSTFSLETFNLLKDKAISNSTYKCGCKQCILYYSCICRIYCCKIFIKIN